MSKSARNGSLALVLLALGALVAWLARTQGADDAPSRRAPEAETATELPSFTADAPSAPEAAPVVVPVGEPSPNAAASATRVIVRVSWAADASPAADIRLKLYAFDQPDPDRHVVLGRTDAQGTWILDPAPLGHVCAYSDRGGDVEGIVKAGQTLELSLALAAGTLVTGIVVDPEQRPVAGADIWLSSYGNHTRGTIVAQSGADGRFVIRGVAPWRYVGARAAGHVPSPLETVDNDAPAAMELRLQLGGEGAAVRGVVVRPGDATSEAKEVPVAGAVVWVGPEGGWPGPDPRRSGNGPPPLELVTAADGTYSAADLPPGTTPVAVRAEGWSPWHGWFKAASGETVELRTVLSPSATIEGTVRGPDGAALAGAEITAVRGYDDVDWVQTKSDAAGHFVLRDISLGEVLARASAKDLGEDKRTFHVLPGKSYAWDPVLSLGSSIVGRVVDESGESVEGLNLQADPESHNGRRRTASVAADGRFVLTNCDSPPYELSVFARNWSFPPLLTVPGVKPGPDELRLVLVAGLRNLATVTGRVVDARGRTPASVHVSLMNMEINSGKGGHFDAATGEITVKDVRAGSYTLWLQAEGASNVPFPVKDLQPGEHRDVGRLVLPEPATVVVQLQLAPGLQANQVSCWLRTADGAYGGGSLPGMEDGLLERRSGPLAPGDYVVVAGGSFALRTEVPVTLVGGREARVEVALEKGVRADLRFVMPYAESHELHVSITDAAGVAVTDESPDPTPFPDRNESRAILSVVLRPGHYGLRVTLDGKDSLQTGFDVPGVEGNAPIQEFTLP